MISTGIIYFLVIVFANTIGAVSGMGGGVIIKPVFDLLGAHSVSAISFYSAAAVFTMAVVSTTRQIRSTLRFDWTVVFWLSAGSTLGGILGNIVFEQLLHLFHHESLVQLIQIILTIATLLFAFLSVKYDFKNYHFKSIKGYLGCGLLLGFLASLLGIGGGPINVSLLIMLFSFPIKEAAVYSICIILWSQLAKLVTIAFTVGFAHYDLTMLLYIIPAAVIGGFLGAQISRLLSADQVAFVFQCVILLVLVINLYNAYQLF